MVLRPVPYILNIILITCKWIGLGARKVRGLPLPLPSCCLHRWQCECVAGSSHKDSIATVLWFKKLPDL